MFNNNSNFYNSINIMLINSNISNINNNTTKYYNRSSRGSFNNNIIK